MRVLLLAGEGPYFKNSEYLDGTMFDRELASELERRFEGVGFDAMRLDHMRYESPDGPAPLIRSKRGLVPHLTSFTLDSILRETEVEYELFRLERVWNEQGAPRLEPDVVLLSTTFICDRQTLRCALRWIAERYPAAKLVLGGQYSNLKFAQILHEHPHVDLVVRGDGEEALTALLEALHGRRELADVPNLVQRKPSGNGVQATPLEYINLDARPSPSFPGSVSIVPYESMRGCPFSCKFCSFPAASPKWRYKSAEKIASDWQRYTAVNGARHIRAMDSTFTVPYRRLRALLERLDGAGISWEAYSRANNIKSQEMVEALARASCKTLSMGFESMSDNTLTYMNKLVTSTENRRAFELLHGSDVSYRVSVMVGYPGETPEDFEQTFRFLRDEYAGHYMLSIFSFTDETMPVWQDAERFKLRILDEEHPDSAWTHIGMDVETARSLHRKTLDATRLQSERASVLLWQTDYETPLIPHLSRAANMRVEKLVDRLGMTPRDYPSLEAAAPTVEAILHELRRYGVTRGAAEGSSTLSEVTRHA